MRKIIICLCVVYTCSIYAYSASEVDERSTLIDPQLSSCVANNLDVSEAEITASDMEKVTNLSCPNQKIKSIDGIQYATNLEELDLSNNQISDISPLSDLTTLKTLSLSTNEITSISPLTNLVNLNYLNLNNNQIDSLEAISNIKELTWLEFNNNNLQNISAIANLNKLEHLEFSNNQVSDISALKSLSNLKTLRMNSNQITDISVLLNLSTITILEMNNNQIKSLNGLENLADLNILFATDNQIKSVEALANNQRLSNLKLDNNRISSLTGLEGATKLQRLTADNNKISDISQLKELRQLQILSLANNQISDSSVVSNFSRLQELNLDNNKLEALNGVDDLRDLKYLSANNNQIGDIENVEKLTSLRALQLANNLIADVRPLANLSGLESLDISKNQILDLSPLSNLNLENKLEASNQLIIMEPREVAIPTTISYQAIDIDGTSYSMNSKVSEPGLTKLELEWNNDTYNENSNYSGSIIQVVEYTPASKLQGKTRAEIDEEQPLSDQQLIDLYEVENDQGEKITVDQSTIDYSTPGSYQISFSDQSGNKLFAKLIVKDALPTLSLSKKRIVVDIGEQVNYVSKFGVQASELATGDMNESIKIDDSQVNLERSGSYKVYFSVSDQEGNTVQRSGVVDVVGKSIEIQVYDQAGNGLPGYEYTIYDENGKVVAIVVTDENGHAQVDNLPPGDYTVVLTGKPTDGTNAEAIVNTQATGSPMSPSTSPTSGTKMASPSGSSASESESQPSYNLHIDKGTKYIQQVNSVPEVTDEQNAIIFYVVDKRNKPLANIQFELVSDSEEDPIVASSDARGMVKFSDLKPGEYTIILSENQGYKQSDEKKIIINDQGFIDGSPNYVVLTRDIDIKIIFEVALLAVVSAIIIKRGSKHGK